MSLLKNRFTVLVTIGSIAAGVVLAAPHAEATSNPTVVVGANVNLSQGLGNQFEASVAIDPTNPMRMFSLGRDETGSLTGARTSDGGATWTHAKMGTSINSVDKLPPSWGNTSVTFDEFGNLFVVYLGPIPQTWASFALSTDGGATFTHQTAIANLTDQPVVAAGHGSVWVTYNRGGVNLAVGAAVTGLGIVGAFGPAQTIVGGNGGAFGDIAVGPAGEVMVAFGPHGASGDVIVSVDADGLGPNGFSVPIAAATTNVGGFTYVPVAPNWGIDSEAHLAWDHSGGAHNGRVFLAFLNSVLTDPVNTDLYVAYSDDGGTTWSTPALVNDDATDASQVMPGLAIDQTTGAIGATWYDTRGDATRSTVRYYGSVSADGGASWAPNFAISAGSSDQAGATPPAQIKDTDFGDYTGLAFHGGVMVPVWADNSNSTGDNPAGASSSFDVYTAVVVVTLAPPPPPPSSTTVSLAAAVPVPVFGQRVRLTASVVSAVVAPRKVVVGVVDLLDGESVVGSASVHGGRAIFDSAVLGAGQHVLVARYNGSGPVQAAVSTPMSLTVAPAASSVVIAGPKVVAGAKPAQFAVRVRTSKPGAGVASGSVTVSDGATVVANAPLDVAGRAALTIASLGAGNHTLTFTYDGDANHLSSTSARTLTIR